MKIGQKIAVGSSRRTDVMPDGRKQTGTTVRTVQDLLLNTISNMHWKCQNFLIAHTGRPVTILFPLHNFKTSQNRHTRFRKCC